MPPLGNQGDIHTAIQCSEAGLWYESLKPIAVDWNGLQAKLRQQYSRIGNTRVQLFLVWISFHFDENSETVDCYVTYIRQVAALLEYGKHQVPEVCYKPFYQNYTGFFLL